MNQFVIHLIPKTHAEYVKDVGVFDTVIGQSEVCKKLSFFTKSHSDTTPLPTLLFTGSQGLGKTYMANKVAMSMGRELVEINCGSMVSAKDFVDKILVGKVMGETPKTILLDEAHKLSNEITTLLLTLLNPNVNNTNLLSYNGNMIEYDFSRINTILATTDAYRVFKPLVNRCVEIYFQLYSNEDLCNILQLYLPNITIDCDREDLSYACRGRARDAYLLSQNIKRYCRMNNITLFSNEHWKKVKEIFGIHDFGLTTQEVRLMQEVSNSSPISSSNLAIKMGVSVANVESELEVRLRELNLLDNTSRGRVLTQKGETYLFTV